MLFESSSVCLDSDSGNVWWFHSEFTFPEGSEDGISGVQQGIPGINNNSTVNLSKNTVQWVPFGPLDVVHLEHCYREWKEDESETHKSNSNADEFKCPKRFAAVKKDSSQYLKVDLKRMRMMPIYWSGEEYFVRRATWFCVPEGAKKIEGFPVPAELDSLLTARYEETREWIGNDHSVGDETIVEKIVPLTGEEQEGKERQQQQQQKQLLSQPSIDPYFLVFRQHSHDYARLCIERPHLTKSSSSASTPTGTANGSAEVVANANEALPNQPLPSRSPSPTPAQSPKLLLDSRSCESARLYRTYASFFHAVAGSSSIKPSASSTNATPSGHAASTNTPVNKPANVQTQMQTNSDPRGEDPVSKSSNSKGSKSSSSASTSSANQSTAIRPAQKHSFKNHPLPSPELPATQPKSAHVVENVIFVVHGVGQRVWRKMGLSFNKDCDELRNVLEEAGMARGLHNGSITVLPVGWRSELDLAGNFTFGDEDADEDSFEAMGEFDGMNSNELLVDSHDILTVSSVFKGQFTEILERLALDSIPAVRSVLSDATMDILLYVSPKHFDRILGAVRREVLRLYKLFMHWNPDFKGNFNFVAHSLGSALVADLLSWTLQPDELIAKLDNDLKKSNDDNVDKSIERTNTSSIMNHFQELGESEKLPFVVDKFFAMGSPLGVFHLLKHTKPVGCARSPHIEAALKERIRRWRAARARTKNQPCGHVPLWTVYNCRLFYNLFHPHDPVAHRFESLTLPGGKSLTRSRFASLSLSNYNANAKEDVVEDARASNTGSISSNKSTNTANVSANNSTSTTLPPPLKIPYHKSGLTRFTMDLEAKIARAKNDWNTGLKRIASWFGGSGAGKTATEDSNANETTTSMTSSSTSIINCTDPLATFNHHFRRIDFALQDGLIENPYLSALSAHFGYWPDLDIASFIVSEFIKREESSLE